MQDVFAAKPMGCLCASVWQSLLEWPSLGGGDAGAWNATRSGRLQGIAPYRMPCSCSTTDVSRYHVDTAVPEFIAELVSGLPIKGPVKLVATTIIIDGRGIVGDLLIAFARIGRAQFVEAFEVVRMEDVSGGAYDALLEIEVALVRCQ